MDKKVQNALDAKEINDKARQLYIKLDKEYKEIFPINFIHNIFDKVTGNTLTILLARYNHIYIPYVGDKETARLAVPMIMRRPGLFITYITSMAEIITETYIGNKTETDDEDWKLDENWATNITSDNLSDEWIKPGSITLEMLSQEILDLINAEGHFEIINYPDGEDLESIKVQDNIRALKFKDRKANNIGRGYIILRKNHDMVLTQDMFSQENTTYEIRYNFSLAGNEVNIPTGSCLQFNGGKIDNGVLIGNSTIIADTKADIFGSNLNLQGTFIGTVSPLNFGLEPLNHLTSAKYLYETHKKALAVGLVVNYLGISRINIEIFDSFQSIPLGNYTDFSNCEFHIINNKKKVYLFTRGGERPRIELNINKDLLKRLDYTSVPELQRGKFILVVQDMNVWSKRQMSIGQTDIYRYDIISIQDGYSRNLPIYNYDSEDSNPSFYAINVDEDKSPIIANGKFYRENSTKLTNLFIVEKIDNLTVKDIYVYTDKYTAPDDIAADSTFYFDRVTNLTMERVYQMNTYSKAASAATHGYFATFMSGFNIKLLNINANDNDWGVIGSRCLNKVFVDKCNINRFDIHIYGKDVFIRDTIINDRFCQFGGVYGDVVFEGCTFNDCFTACLCEQTFNYYTPFNLYFKNCELNNTTSLYRCSNPNMNIAPIRIEQSKKYLPNIFIDGLRVNLGLDETFVIIYGNNNWAATEYYEGFYGLTRLYFKNFEVNYDPNDTRLFHRINLQYNTLYLLECPHIVLDNCKFGKFKSENDLENITTSQTTETLRVANTKLPVGKKGKYVIKNSLMTLPTREYAPYDFTIEDSVIIAMRHNSLEENKYNNYRFINTRIHFNRQDVINNCTANMGDYIGCEFIFYSATPTLYFTGKEEKGDLNCINCKTNKQQYGTVLAGRVFVPYNEDNKVVIENEFMHLHMNKNTDGSTVWTLLEQDVADSLVNMPKEAYNYPKILNEVSNKLIQQRIKYSKDEDAEWEVKPVAVVLSGSTDNRPDALVNAGMTYYDYSLRRLLVWSGEVWRYANSGYNAKHRELGTSAQRPLLTELEDRGFQYWDTTLKKPIWWDGDKWIVMGEGGGSEPSRLPSKTVTKYALTNSINNVPQIDKTNINPGQVWLDTIPTRKSTKEIIWGTQGIIDPNEPISLVGEWSEPYNITGVDGTDGEPGKPGEDAKIPDWKTYIYTSSDSKPNKPNSVELIPPGWVDYPTDSGGQWWQCIGVVNGETNKVKEWSEVLPLNGKNGQAQDGKKTEFRFAKNNSSINPPYLDKTVRNPLDWNINPVTITESEYLWMTEATINPDDTLATNWSDPVRISGEVGPPGPPGEQGDPGPQGVTPNWKTYVYQKLATKPNKPTGNTPSAPGGNWVDYPTGDGTWWQCIGEVNGQTNRIISWSDVIPLNGKDGIGQDGKYTEFRFCVNTTPNTYPTINRGSREPDGWTITVPEITTGQYLWMTNAVIKPDNSLEGTWSLPVRINGEDGQDGSIGAKGPIVYPAGVYELNKTYTNDGRSTPYVLDQSDGKYYILNGQISWKGTEHGNRTPSQDYAESQGANWLQAEQFETIFAKVAVIANGLIGSAVFNGNFMFSQQGKNAAGNDTVDYQNFNPADPYASTNTFKPNVCINFLTGEMWLGAGNIYFAKDGSGYLAKNNFSIDASGNIVMKGILEADYVKHKVLYTLDPVTEQYLPAVYTHDFKNGDYLYVNDVGNIDYQSFILPPPEDWPGATLSVIVAPPLGRTYVNRSIKFRCKNKAGYDIGFLYPEYESLSTPSTYLFLDSSTENKFGKITFTSYGKGWFVDGANSAWFTNS